MTRYMRQLVLPDMNVTRQQKLLASKVLVVGAGGLGSPAIEYLAAAGVGTIGIVDADRVALSNLQRQIIYGTDQIGIPKVEAAAAFVARLNPAIRVDRHIVRIDLANAAELTGQYDLVLDCTDNLATRRIVASACRTKGKPLVSGAVSLFEGHVTVFPYYGDQEQFEMLFGSALDEREVPSCEMLGVLGAVAGVIGSMMAVEAFKLLTGVGSALTERVFVYDGRNGRAYEMELPRTRRQYVGRTDARW